MHPNFHPLRTGCLFLLLTTVLAPACTRPPKALPNKVLFDQGHGQHAFIDRQGPGDLSEFARLLQDQGLQAVASNAPLSNESLAGCTAVVISAPLAPLTNPELASLGKFMQQGGQLCLLLKVAAPASPLLQSLGLAASNNTINELNHLPEESPSNFEVSHLLPHPLTRDLRHFRLHGALALDTAEEANVIAKTGPQAWIDLNGNGQRDRQDAQQPFNVVVGGQYGRGRFVVFGGETLFHNQLLSGENRRLAENLANWLRDND